MDDDFDAMYRVEQRMSKVFILFTIMSIAIACLGLFGLAAYAAEQRNKEISIRKVLGADVSALVLTLNGISRCFCNSNLSGGQGGIGQSGQQFARRMTCKTVKRRSVGKQQRSLLFCSQNLTTYD